jgi:hypothetical protein
MQYVSLAFSALLLAGVSSAQIAPCLADNDANPQVATNAFFGIQNSAPGVHGWQLVPPTTTTAVSMRVYTGNNYMSMTGNFAKLEIFDDAQGLPGQSLASGTFRMRSGKSWLGCNFDTPVSMQQGTPYWIVFTEPGWSNAPLQTSGGTNYPMYRLNTVTNVWSPYNFPEALKYRIYCGPLERQGVSSIGAACPNSSGSLGTAFTNDAPTVGNGNFLVEGTGFTPGTFVAGVLGVNPAWPSIPFPGAPGCFVNSSGDVLLSLQAGVGDVRAVQPDGHVEMPLGIPSNGALAGFFFSAQFAAFDFAVGTPVPFVTSNGLGITIY